MRRFAVVLSLVLVLAAPRVRAQATFSPSGLAEAIEAVLGHSDFRSATWGALVVDVASGQRLYASNEYRRFIPASNVKLFTTSAVLDALGPDFRYTTRLYADGPVAGGTLFGTLVVRGSGDPTFGGRYTGGDLTLTFRQWADSLRTRGIRRISGRVVGDDSIFGSDDTGTRGLGAGWEWGDLPYGYAAPVSGLQFNEGTVSVTLAGTETGQPATVTLAPELAGGHTTAPYGGFLSLANRTTTVEAGTPSATSFTRALGANAYTLTSSVAAGEVLTHTMAVTNPTDFFVRALVAVLQREGIEVDGAAVSVDEWGERPSYGRMTQIATFRSPPLSAIVGVVNDDSNNLYAETLMRTLGAYEYAPSLHGGRHARGSFEAGVAVAEPFYRRLGVDTRTITLADGSGLSRHNWVTPESVVALLVGMHGHPQTAVWDTFYRSLPLGGFTGTLRNRYAAGDARGNVRAKTGFINGVRTLSGYVTAKNGRLLAFSLLCNNYTTPTARVNRAQDAVVELLADYEGR